MADFSVPPPTIRQPLIGLTVNFNNGAYPTAGQQGFQPFIFPYMEPHPHMQPYPYMQLHPHMQPHPMQPHPMQPHPPTIHSNPSHRPPFLPITHSLPKSNYTGAPSCPPAIRALPAPPARCGVTITELDSNDSDNGEIGKEQPQQSHPSRSGNKSCKAATKLDSSANVQDSEPYQVPKTRAAARQASSTVRSVYSKPKEQSKQVISSKRKISSVKQTAKICKISSKGDAADTEGSTDNDETDVPQLVKKVSSNQRASCSEQVLSTTLMKKTESAAAHDNADVDDSSSEGEREPLGRWMDGEESSDNDTSVVPQQVSKASCKPRASSSKQSHMNIPKTKTHTTARYEAAGSVRDHSSGGEDLMGEWMDGEESDSEAVDASSRFQPFCLLVQDPPPPPSKKSKSLSLKKIENGSEKFNAQSKALLTWLEKDEDAAETKDPKKRAKNAAKGNEDRKFESTPIVVISDDESDVICDNENDLIHADENCRQGSSGLDQEFELEERQVTEESCVICFDKFVKNETYIGVVHPCNCQRACYHCSLQNLDNYGSCMWCRKTSYLVTSVLYGASDES
ncbi:Segment polarity protein dishevelled-like protein DVL-3 [Frankliniella fusca]|uniref:Segment polarity protein dishevelled-like protein DVL-3 n=1 Tax=Frankliniella fusca TaxID=407009 RepID=A0AAE1GZ00_9NEOP|nr:Segment polarity protein dishevelled-like protein DVL-3 [Frankliniella fusca]